MSQNTQQTAKVVSSDEQSKQHLNWSDSMERECPGCDNGLDSDSSHRDENGDYYENCGVNPVDLQEQQELIQNSTFSEPSTPSTSELIDLLKEAVQSGKHELAASIEREIVDRDDEDSRSEEEFHRLPPTVEIFLRLPISVKGALCKDDGFLAIEKAVASMYRGFRIFMRSERCYGENHFILSICAEDEKRFPRGLYDTIQNLISDRIRSNSSRRRPTNTRKSQRNQRNQRNQRENRTDNQEKTERLTEKVVIDERYVAWCVGKGRANLKRICEAAKTQFPEESVFIKAPPRHVENPVFELYAIKQETLDFLKEELEKSADMCHKRQ